MKKICCLNIDYRKSFNQIFKPHSRKIFGVWNLLGKVKTDCLKLSFVHASKNHSWADNIFEFNVIFYLIYSLKFYYKAFKFKNISEFIILFRTMLTYFIIKPNKLGDLQKMHSLGLYNFFLLKITFHLKESVDLILEGMQYPLNILFSNLTNSWQAICRSHCFLITCWFTSHSLFSYNLYLALKLVSNKHK